MIQLSSMEIGAMYFRIMPWASCERLRGPGGLSQGKDELLVYVSYSLCLEISVSRNFWNSTSRFIFVSLVQPQFMKKLFVPKRRNKVKQAVCETVKSV